MRDLAGRLAGRVRLTTDGLSFYRPAVEEAFGADVDFAQLVKGYGRDDDPETERRYSPAVTAKSTARRVTGRPDRGWLSGGSLG